VDRRKVTSYLQLLAKVSMLFGFTSHLKTNCVIPSACPLNVEIHIQSFTIPHFPSLMIAMSKPAYLTILEYFPAKPVIVFVASHRKCRLTVDDLLTHCTADDVPDRFLNIELEHLQPHLDHTRDQGLVEILKHGIGYYHEALDKQDKMIIRRLFESGAIQVLVASKVSWIVCLWGLGLTLLA
jgi:pre-mRNA-splicing helicase BRR2